ncbi:MAG: cytochrome c biogenesis protein CcsA [Chitinophagales bacterium]|nr:cytochrome c biogenesis protein CcsA [Chitinophagales bacterium]
MYNFLKQWWWKVLATVLIIYTLIMGFLIPLGTGIVDIEPSKTNAGDTVQVKIEGYNSHFLKGNGNQSLGIKAFLKNDENLLCAASVEAKSDRTLWATFEIPADLKIESKTDFYSIVVTDPYDGTFFLANAFGISRVDTSLSSRNVSCVKELTIEKGAATTFPYREILYETIRNLFFHVPMWFAMIAMLIFSFGSSIAYLNSGNSRYDIYAHQAVIVGVFFGILGLLSGMVWAKNTWGAYWTNDPRLNGAAVGELVYIAYLVLRNSLTNDITRSKVSAVYNIFGFVIYIVFIFVVPRINDSLHPGQGGNPAFSNYDLDSTLRLVFYPACMGFILLAFWLSAILIRMEIISKESAFIDSKP